LRRNLTNTQKRNGPTSSLHSRGKVPDGKGFVENKLKQEGEGGKKLKNTKRKLQNQP